jgi:hypothetical protein
MCILSLQGSGNKLGSRTQIYLTGKIIKAVTAGMEKNLSSKFTA